MIPKNILITGGSGFLGQALIRFWLNSGHSITVLSRNTDKTQKLLGQAVKCFSRLSDIPRDTHFDAIVNLAGCPIFGGLWTDKRKQQIRASRVDLTHALLAFVRELASKPEVLISGSAIGIYGDQGDTLLSEDFSSTSNDFARQLCLDWEQAALQFTELGVRVCLIRTGLVLDHDGGLLGQMLPGFKLGLGGRLGNGKQWMAWIHRQDWVAIADRLLVDKHLSGAFNATAPKPVTNAEFTRLLGIHLHRPTFMHMPALLLKSLLGEMSSLMLGSQRVIPKRMLESELAFQFEDLDSALDQILVAK